VNFNIAENVNFCRKLSFLPKILIFAENVFGNNSIFLYNLKYLQGHYLGVIDDDHCNLSVFFRERNFLLNFYFII